MADIYGPFLEALRTLIVSAWPDAADNGNYLAAQVQRASFERKAEAGELPFAVIDYSFRGDGRWGVTVRAESGPVWVYYVVSDAEHLEDDVLSVKLEALRALIAADGALYPAAQVLHEPNPACSVGADLPLQRYFANSQRPFWCGAVMFHALIGE